MIKLLKWVLIIFIILLIIVFAALFIFIRNFDVNRYKDKITQALSEELGHSVEIKKINIDFSLERGLNLGVKEFYIWEKPPSVSKIVAVENVFLGVDIKAFIKDRQVVISRVELLKPQIYFVQYEDNSTNIQALIKQPTDTTGEGKGLAQKKIPATSKKVDPGDFKVLRIDVKEARIHFEKQINGGQEIIELKDVNLSIDNFTLKDEFSIKASMNFYSDKPNVFLESLAQINQSAQEVKLRKLKINNSLSTFDVDLLVKSFKAIEQAGLEGLSGEIVLLADEIIMAPPTSPDYKFEARLTDGKVKIKPMSYPVENIDIVILGKSPDLTLKEFFMYIGRGNIKAQGEIRDLLGGNVFNGNALIDGLYLEELIDQQESQVKLSGAISGSVEFSGLYNAVSLLDESLKAQAAIELNEGKIINLNVLKAVFDKLSFIPNLAENMENKLPQRYKDRLKERDTAIDICTAQATVIGKDVIIKDVTLEADGFQLAGSGKMDFDQNIYLQADVYLASDVAGPLLSSSDGLSFLLEEDDRLHIPLKSYRGPLQKLRLYPDVEDLSKKAIQTKGKQELKKAIFKALDLEDIQPQEPSTIPQENPQTQAQPTKTQESQPEGILIENVLDAIFK